MKGNTWIVVMIAVAVTGSMVVAKSFISFPNSLAAAPVAAVANEDPKLAEPPLPILVGQEEPPLPGVMEQAPTVDATQGGKSMNDTWTVMVVHGNEIEHVTYVNGDVKSPTP